MKKALASLMGMELVKESKGFIGKEFIDELKKLDEADDKLKAQIKEEFEALVDESVEKIKAEIQGRMKDKYGKKIADLSSLQEKVMLEAFKAAGIDEEYDDSIIVNKHTGEVIKREFKTEEDVDQVFIKGELR